MALSLHDKLQNLGHSFLVDSQGQVFGLLNDQIFNNKKQVSNLTRSGTTEQNLIDQGLGDLIQKVNKPLNSVDDWKSTGYDPQSSFSTSGGYRSTFGSNSGDVSTIQDISNLADKRIATLTDAAKAGGGYSGQGKSLSNEYIQKLLGTSFAPPTPQETAQRQANTDAQFNAANAAMDKNHVAPVLPSISTPSPTPSNDLRPPMKAPYSPPPANQKEYEQQRADVVNGLVQQGITNPNQILNYVNFDESGAKTGDFTIDEINFILGKNKTSVSSSFTPTDYSNTAKLSDLQKTVMDTNASLNANDAFINGVFKAFHNRDATKQELDAYRGKKVSDVRTEIIGGAQSAGLPTVAPGTVNIPTGMMTKEEAVKQGLQKVLRPDQLSALGADQIIRDNLGGIWMDPKTTTQTQRDAVASGQNGSQISNVHPTDVTKNDAGTVNETIAKPDPSSLDVFKSGNGGTAGSVKEQAGTITTVATNYVDSAIAGYDKQIADYKTQLATAQTGMDTLAGKITAMSKATPNADALVAAKKAEGLQAKQDALMEVKRQISVEQQKLQLGLAGEGDKLAPLSIIGRRQATLQAQGLARIGALTAIAQIDQEDLAFAKDMVNATVSAIQADTKQQQDALSTLVTLQDKNIVRLTDEENAVVKARQEVLTKQMDNIQKNATSVFDLIKGNTGAALKSGVSLSDTPAVALSKMAPYMAAEAATKAQANNTQVVEVNGKKLLINSSTGKTIQDLGTATSSSTSTPKPFQYTASNFATRLDESGSIISNLEDKFTGAESYLGTYLPNILKSSDRQQLEQAEKNFLNAVLRRESGAVISPSEFANGAKQYFPQPGDTTEVLAQKKSNREMVTRNLINESGSALDEIAPQLKTKYLNQDTQLQGAYSELQKKTGIIDDYNSALQKYGADALKKIMQDNGISFSKPLSMGVNGLGMRTDRNNNPTAFTTDVAKNAGLKEGVDYLVGDTFPNDANLHTATLLGNPIDQTIKVIDKIGFYTTSGQQRWTHTAVPKKEWDAMNYDQKKEVIKKMYQNEGGMSLNGYFA